MSKFTDIKDGEPIILKYSQAQKMKGIYPNIPGLEEENG